MMDYSLLLIVERVPKLKKLGSLVKTETLRTPRSGGTMEIISVDSQYFKEKLIKSRNTLESTDGSELYHIGIIDYLQRWDLFKKGEACMKSQILRRDKYKISATGPDQYCKRFKNFMKDKVFNDKNTLDTIS